MPGNDEASKELPDDDKENNTHGTSTIFDRPPPNFYSLRCWHVFLNKHSHRDKLGKIVHYGSRGFVGLCGNLLPLVSNTSMLAGMLLAAQGKFRVVFKNIMNTRRCVRWLSGTGIILDLINGQHLSLRVKAIKGLLLTWMFSDHFRYLQQLKLIGGDQAFTRNWGFACACASWSLAAYHHTTLLMASKPVPNESTKERTQRTAANNKMKRQIVRNTIASISAAHISQLFVHSEAICGFFGAGAAAFDMWELFPRSA
jgi:hypothetical protein